VGSMRVCPHAAHVPVDMLHENAANVLGAETAYHVDDAPA